MTAIQRTAPASIVTRLSEATGFNRAQVEIIKDTIAKGASDDELMVFLMLAQRTGLDPFSRQIYLIERRSNDNGEWKTTRQPMTGIDGLRLTADRTGNYAPGRAPTFEYDQDGNLFSATAYVWKFVKNDWREVSATAHYAEYVQTKRDGKPNKFWGEKPHIMLSKCAEALALRRAFPADLSGLYTNDEIAPDEQQAVIIQHPAVQNAPRLVAPAPTADTDTGEVIDLPSASGTVSGVQVKENAKGEAWATFAVEGANVVITAKVIDHPGIECLEDGDLVHCTYTPKSNKGKTINVLDSIDGEKNADGLTPWEQRATEITGYDPDLIPDEEPA